VAPLGLRPLQELASRRHVREQVGDLDARARRHRDLAFAHDASPIEPDLVAGTPVVGAAQPRAQSHARDRGDRRQRLAAEAEARDAQQVVGRRQLAGGVALQAQVGVAR
jgi:hypothetical protein